MSGLAVWHYRREEVCREIAEYLEDRWVALYTGRTWIRWMGDKPLTIVSHDSVRDLAERYGVRSFYGTLEKFRVLEERRDVFENYPVNIETATMYIDIDVIDEYRVEEALPNIKKILKVLTDWLKNKGITESVYILWSGAGAHLRIHEKAIGEVEGLDPLEAAYLLAEYILRSNTPTLTKIISESKGLIKIENMIGRNRVFTAPLSLHRNLERSAITFKPEEINEFTLAWTIPGREKHDSRAWRVYEEGEAKNTIIEALKILGKAPDRTILPGVRKPHRVKGERGIGRFPVMALLQAARYYIVNGDIEKAKSFGLNRAIFYAWAKYYGPARSAAKRLKTRGRIPGRKTRSGIEIKPVPGLEEEAPISEDGWFAMGDVEQRPEDFDRNVAGKFEAYGVRFDDVWRAALYYVSSFPQNVLRDPQRFYKLVYEPVRDSFFEKVMEGKPERIYHPHIVSRKTVDKTGVRLKDSGRPRPKSLLDWMKEDKHD